MRVNLAVAASVWGLLGSQFACAQPQDRVDVQLESSGTNHEDPNETETNKSGTAEDSRAPQVTTGGRAPQVTTGGKTPEVTTDSPGRTLESRPERPHAAGRTGASPAALLREQATVPSQLPGGYVMEAKGQARWIYPEAAQEEVLRLQQELPNAQRKLEQTFGVSLDPSWDIRVARQANEMAALAPGHTPPDYAMGVAYPAEGLILLSLAEPFSFGRPDMAKLLVHEMAHVALYQAVQGQSVPRWFNEGLAIHEAGERSLARLRTLWEAAMRRQLQPIAKLSHTFPGNHHEISIAYAQSADLVRHMLDGSDERARFRQLLEAIRQGQRFDQAVQATYGVSMGYIEREWRNGILRRFGRWPSLLTGLTALWALTAIFLLVGYVRARRRHKRTLAQWSAEEAREDALQHAALIEQPETTAQAQLAAADARSGASQEAGGQGQTQSQRIDDFMDRFQRRSTTDTDIPTVEHDGQSHTLH